MDSKELQKSRDFTGKVVLVTGSNAGLGESMVKLFSQLGAQVVVTGRNSSEVDRVAKEVQELSPKKLKPVSVVADVTKRDDLNRLLNETIRTFGKLDVLVNNAGMAARVGIRDPNIMEAFDSVLQTNLRAYVELSHLSVPYLEKTNGNIINISSDLAFAPRVGTLPYQLSKVSIDMMTKVLALELGPKIRVNTINPGYTPTNLSSGRLTPEQLDVIHKRIISFTPLQRAELPLDIAKGAVFLASSDASFITGANLLIDGGMIYNISELKVPKTDP